MFSLIITIISIAIFGVLLSAGISYIDTDGVLAKKDALNIQSSIVGVGMGMTSYRNLIGNEATDKTQLIPAFVKLDALPSYVRLLTVGTEPYQGSPNNRYACFEANMDSLQERKSIGKLNNDVPENTLIFVSDCTQSSEDVSLTDATNTISFKFYY